jgi:hypothetical protein
MSFGNSCAKITTSGVPRAFADLINNQYYLWNVPPLFEVLKALLLNLRIITYSQDFKIYGGIYTTAASKLKSKSLDLKPIAIKVAYWQYAHASKAHIKQLKHMAKGFKLLKGALC